MAREKPMTIHVTQEHIDKGIQKNACHCPIALAIKEARSDIYVVYVMKEMSSIYPHDFQKPTDYRMPKLAGDFVRRFDAGQDVEPFTFELGEKIL